MAPVLFPPALAPVWFFPAALSTLSFCLAAGAVVSFCRTGPCVTSLHRAGLLPGSPGLAGPSSASSCSGTPACHPVSPPPSGFWVTESTSVSFQLSPATSVCPASPSMRTLCPKAALKVSFSPTSLCSTSVCRTVPSVLSFHLATSSLCSRRPLGSLFCPSHSSSSACLALIRPHGNGAGGRKGRNKALRFSVCGAVSNSNTKAALFLSKNGIQPSCKSPGTTLTPGLSDFTFSNHPHHHQTQGGRANYSEKNTRLCLFWATGISHSWLLQEQSTQGTLQDRIQTQCSPCDRTA